jgi:hypothetical protein
VQSIIVRSEEWSVDFRNHGSHLAYFPHIATTISGIQLVRGWLIVPIGARIVMVQREMEFMVLGTRVFRG